MLGERQTLILVVGMHRSGTSLLGSILPALGVATPGPLITGDQHNPEGYYEREDVTALQEQLLINLQRWWPSQEGVLPLPATWMEQPAGQACAAGLMRLVRQEKACQTGPWAIKDPRSSLLLPLWQRLAESLELDLRIVLSLRDPREVQRSLVQRDRSSTGMTSWRAQQLWWRHNSQAAFDSLQADLPLLVVHYSRWFDAKQADRQLQRLAKFCLGEEASPSALEQAQRCIRPEHRRSNAGPHWLHPTLAQLERKLQRLPGNHRRVQRWLAAQPQTLCLPFGRLRGRLPSPSFGLQLSNDPIPNCSGPIQLVGSDWSSWQAHAWLQHVPMASPGRQPQLIAGPWPRWGRPPAVLHLQPVSRNSKLLAQLRHCPVVYDPDPDRCRQLRALGVNAHWLQGGQGGANDWLETCDPAAASHELGLPPIDALGQSPLPVLCLGSGGDRFEQQLEPPCWCLPGFDQVQIHSPAQARLLASWLNQAQLSGYQLVRLQPTQ
ncbi:MAG: hypothetical protein VKM98_10500, partial [Cyanobacteriota bacterium]|nr:hypothetical protein [Cyanobacteriota bacterium]